MSVGSIITTVLSILSFLGIGTLFTLFWQDRHNARLEKTAKRKAEAKKERQEEIREVFKSEIKPLEERLRIVEDLLKTDCEGTQAGLRNDLLNAYYTCAQKGFRTRYDSENFRDMFEAYTKLKGNSFIQHDVKNWFEEIPSKEEFERIKGE